MPTTVRATQRSQATISRILLWRAGVEMLRVHAYRPIAVVKHPQPVRDCPTVVQFPGVAVSPDAFPCNRELGVVLHDDSGPKPAGAYVTTDRSVLVHVSPEAHLNGCRFRKPMPRGPGFCWKSTRQLKTALVMVERAIGLCPEVNAAVRALFGNAPVGDRAEFGAPSTARVDVRLTAASAVRLRLHQRATTSLVWPAVVQGSRRPYFTEASPCR